MSFDHDQDRPSTLAARALLAAAVVISAGAAPARADIDGDTLTSTPHGVRLELPRGWRASEVSVYPGVVVWLSRSSPRVTILVTVDPLVGPCDDPLRFCSASGAIDVLRGQLDVAGFTVTAQAQSRTPELEYQAGGRFLRHAVLVVDDQVVSVVLAADSPTLRSAQRRVFERVVQTVRPLTVAPRRPLTSEDEREVIPP